MHRAIHVCIINIELACNMMYVCMRGWCEEVGHACQDTSVIYVGKLIMWGDLTPKNKSKALEKAWKSTVGVR